MITPLTQQDKRWNTTKLGNTEFTIGRYGCLTTCVSMATQYYNTTVEPKVTYSLPPKLAKSLTFTPQGLLVWSSLSSIGLSRRERFYGQQDDKIRDAIKNPMTVCVLNVNHGNHWVLAYSRNWLGGYNVIDPWDGKRKGTSGFSDITGGAVLTIS